VVFQFRVESTLMIIDAWVLFAYTEVPVASLGCSLFDLLFGRSVSGPSSLLKSAWLHETYVGSAKRNVVKFMLETREQLRTALEQAMKLLRSNMLTLNRGMIRQQLLEPSVPAMRYWSYSQSWENTAC